LQAYLGEIFMKATIAGTVIGVMIGAGVFAQTNQPPLADPLTVKPIPPQVQTADTDMIRAKIIQAGYTDVTDLARDSLGVWRARARKANATVDVIVDKGGRIKVEPR
jgi:hypothetical protein